MVTRKTTDYGATTVTMTETHAHQVEQPKKARAMSRHAFIPNYEGTLDGSTCLMCGRREFTIDGEATHQ